MTREKWMEASPEVAAGWQLDWGLGRYESTAARLLPAARVVVDAAAINPGEHVVDVGCGTGNAGLLAAARGARVTGVDPARRLLAVARESAAARGLYATFVAGDAAALPLADGEARAVLSVFGVIFAVDPAAAMAELARVTAPDGRIVLSAWIPEGPLHAALSIPQAAVARALGAPLSSAGEAPFAWHDGDALATLLEPHGFRVDVAEHRLTIVDRSPAAYLDAESESHPMAVAGRAVLGPLGESDAVRAGMLAILTAGNEDPAAFRITTSYVVATARRD